MEMRLFETWHIKVTNYKNDFPMQSLDKSTFYEVLFPSLLNYGDEKYWGFTLHGTDLLQMALFLILFFSALHNSACSWKLMQFDRQFFRIVPTRKKCRIFIFHNFYNLLCLLFSEIVHAYLFHYFNLCICLSWCGVNGLSTWT